MYILGIDFGTKKLGLALLEDSSGVCSPLPLLTNDDFLWQKLEKVVTDYRITMVIMGLPSYEATAKKVHAFENELIAKFAVKVFFTNEDNTSLVIKKGLNTQKQKQNLDSYSAVEILQQWSGEQK